MRKVRLFLESLTTVSMSGSCTGQSNIRISQLAMLTKVYAKSSRPELRFAPQVCILCKKTPMLGQPDENLICTSHVERQNLNIRLFNRRFTRLTLGYSMSLENLRCSV